MPDLKTLTHTQFEACLDQPFHVEWGKADPLETELIEVEKRGTISPGSHKRQAFSVIFRGPMEPLLPQSIHVLKNKTLGTLEVFLVPIGPDQQGMRYEAIFT